MRSRSRAISVLAAGCVLAACQLAPPGAGPKPGRRPPANGSSVPGTGALADPPPAGVVASPGGGPVTAGGGLVANNGGGVVSNNGAALTGTVKLPTTFISDQGGGIVSNNGGALISDKGGSIIGNNGAGLGAGATYRLAAAPEQRPLAGFEVHLLDAAGEPLRDAAGQPLVAVTGPDGAYAFAGPLPDQALLIDVPLPGDRGRLQALAPRSQAGPRAADADLVSTLTTGYIFDQYIRPNDGPLARIERLPRDVEAATRARAAAALAAADLAPPAALGAGQVTALVDALRKRDAALDRQFEAVKALLVLAGQADLGEGRPATEVSFDQPEALAQAPGGGFFMMCPNDRRVWRVGADGRARLWAGNGEAPAPFAAGTPATAIGLGYPNGLAAAADGTLWLLASGTEEEPTRLLRIAPDGAASLAWSGPQPEGFDTSASSGLAALPAGGVAFVVTGGDAPAVWTFSPGDAGPVRAAGFPTALDGQALDYWDEDLMPAPDGRHRATATLAGEAGDDAEQLVELVLDPGGGPPRVTKPGRGAVAVERLGPAGERARLGPDGSLTYVAPDGAERRLTDRVADLPDPAEGEVMAVLAEPDGGVLVSLRPTFVARARVYRFRDGRQTLVAGAAVAAGAATEVSLQWPIGLAPAADGGMYVVDAGKYVVLRVDEQGQAHAVAGSGRRDADEDAPPSGPDVLAANLNPRHVAFAAGRLFIHQFNSVIAVATDGSYTSAVPKVVGTMLGPMAAGADGTLYVGQTRSVDGEGTRHAVLAHPPAGAAYEVPVPAEVRALGIGPDGLLYGFSRAMDTGRFWRWRADTGLASLAESAALRALDPKAGLAVDADGRVYLADGKTGQVHRFDPADGSLTAVAGPGTANFGGQGVADGLDGPEAVALDAAGNLAIADHGHKQVKRVARDRLGGP